MSTNNTNIIILGSIIVMRKILSTLYLISFWNSDSRFFYAFFLMLDNIKIVFKINQIYYVRTIQKLIVYNFRHLFNIKIKPFFRASLSEYVHFHGRY